MCALIYISHANLYKLDQEVDLKTFDSIYLQPLPMPHLKVDLSKQDIDQQREFEEWFMLLEEHPQPVLLFLMIIPETNKTFPKLFGVKIIN